MNIQDTIKELGLENETLPKILSQRVNAVKELKNSFNLAQAEYEDDPSEENKEKLEEVEKYVLDYSSDVVEQLKSFKSKLDKKKNEDSLEKPIDAIPVTEEKKSSNTTSWVIGTVLLIATMGVVNVLRKN